MRPGVQATRAEREEARFLALKSGPVWRALKAEPLAFWLLCIYLGVEYLRPQHIYPILDAAPIGLLTLGGALAAVVIGGHGVRHFHAIDGILLAFFVWVVVCSLTAFNPGLAWENWTFFVGWAVLYYMVSTLLDSPRRLTLFWLAFMLINLKMSQHGARSFALRGFTFASYGVTGSPGWFQNSGEFAMQMAAIVGMGWFFFLAFKETASVWRVRILLLVFPGTAAMSIIASSSRGGQLAAAVMVVAGMIASRIKPRAIVAVGLVLAVGWLVLPEQQKARFDTMGEDKTSVSRLTYWAEAWEATKENPIFGVGYENWIAYYRVNRSASQVEQVHNTTLQASVELGFPGLLLFLSALGITFHMNHVTRKRARDAGPWSSVLRGMATGLDVGLIGMIVAAQFMSVLFYPMFWCAFGMTTALAETARKAHGKAAAERRALARARRALPVGVRA